MKLRALCISISLLLGSPVLAQAQQDEVVYDDDVTLVSFVETQYPSIAIVTSAAGAVVVSVTLNDDGSVKNAAALSGNKLLVLVATENAKKWRFKPNRQQRAVIVYDFRINEQCALLGGTVFHVLPPNVASVSACTFPSRPDSIRNR